MSLIIVPVATSDNFQVWFDKTNELASAFSNTITVNSHANGSLTTGNGFVAGTFGARNLVGNTIHGGTVQTPALLTVTSNIVVTGNTVTVGNVVVNSTGIVIDGQLLVTGRTAFAVNTSGTSTQQVDYFDKLVYRAAEYFLTVKDNNANAYQATRMVVVHDSGDAYSTQYAVVYSNSAQGDFSANANSTHVRVYLSPVSTNAHVSATRVIVDI